MSEPESQGVTRRTAAIASDPAPESNSEIVEISEAEPAPRSGERSSSDETTTLLSAPTPASSFEIETEDRLTRLERDLSLLRSRLDSVEAQERLASAARHETPQGEAPTGSFPQPSPTLDAKQWRMVLVWVLGLALLAAYGLLK